MIAAEVTMPFVVNKPTKARARQIAQNPVRAVCERGGTRLSLERCELGSVVDTVFILFRLTALYLVEQFNKVSRKALTTEKRHRAVSSVLSYLTSKPSILE